MSNPTKNLRTAYRRLALTRAQRLVFSDHLRGKYDRLIAQQHQLSEARVQLHRARVARKLLRLEPEMRTAVLRHFDELAHSQDPLADPHELITALLKVIVLARRAAVKRLTDRQEFILLLHYAGYSDGKIAHQLGIDRATVREQRGAGTAKLHRVISGGQRVSRNRRLCLQLLDSAATDPSDYKKWCTGPWTDILVLRASNRLRSLQNQRK